MNRRSLFGAIAGAAALPLAGRQKAAAAAPAPVSVPPVWAGCVPMTEAEAAQAFGPGMVTQADLMVKMTAASHTASDAATFTTQWGDPNEVWAALDRELTKRGL